jgi:alpha-beta hydrolase superfamily lysophospholipase
VGQPGTIIRSEPINAALPNAQAWRVLYASTAPDGATIAVSGVVVAPISTAPAGGWPIVAWAHGTSGVMPPCAPSLDADGGLSRVPALDQLLAAGTIATITDYPGLGTPGPHPYLVGSSEGRAVLDSIRAARSLLGNEAGDTSAIYGHSQGGHAALFAGQLAPGYAPELRVAGIAAMAPPTDLADLLWRDRDESLGVMLTALAVTSWSQWYPDAKVEAIVHPEMKALVERAGQRCVGTAPQALAELPDIGLLRLRFLSTNPAQTPGWDAHLQENAPSMMPATIPLLISQGLSDTLVRPDVTAAFVENQCNAGVSIEYNTYPGFGHFDLRTKSSAPSKAATWMLARLHGTAITPGCTTTTQAS